MSILLKNKKYFSLLILKTHLKYQSNNLYNQTINHCKYSTTIKIKSHLGVGDKLKILTVFNLKNKYKFRVDILLLTTNKMLILKTNRLIYKMKKLKVNNATLKNLFQMLYNFQMMLLINLFLVKLVRKY
jgi:hypothetical protein